MANRFITSIDLNRNELQNAVLQPLATDPTIGRVGQHYFNTTTLKERFCVEVKGDGTPVWQEVGGSDDAVKYTKQKLTSTQQIQAQQNINVWFHGFNLSNEQIQELKNNNIISISKEELLSELQVEEDDLFNLYGNIKLNLPNGTSVNYSFFKTKFPYVSFYYYDNNEIYIWKFNLSDFTTSTIERVIDITFTGKVFAGTAEAPAEATEPHGFVTKSQLDSAIASIPGLSYKVVTKLPTSDISKSIIYLVAKATAGTQNAYEEYLNTTGTTDGWEKIGDTEIDLSDYATTTALTAALALKQNTLTAGSGITISSDTISSSTTKFVGEITGDGSTKEFTITHNLGSQDCIASLRDTTTNEVVYADVEFTTANTATIGFADAPKVGENYKITII